MKIKTILYKPISFLFPFLDLILMNGKIKKKLNNYETTLSHIMDADKIDERVLEDRYSETIKTKDKFEDKAKSQIFAITVAITVIFGASNLLNVINKKFSVVWVDWVVFGLYVFSILYLIISGVLAVRLLMHENIISSITLDSHLDNKKLRDQLDVATNENIKRNQIRNNYVFTSYECIRNALICLFIVLVFAILPLNQNSKNKPLSTNLNISFSAEAASYIVENDNQTDVETVITNAFNKNILIEGKTISFIDDSIKMFVKAKNENNQIIVYYFSNYE